MKTENFDDAIRRKIDSINPHYEEEDINRVHSYVNQRKTGGSSRIVGLIVIFFAGGLLIGGLLVWNLFQMQENKQLLQTINSLQNNLATANINTTKVKTDTVFIKEYLVTSSTNQKSGARLSVNRNNLIAEDKPSPQTADKIIRQQIKSHNKNIEGAYSQENSSEKEVTTNDKKLTERTLNVEQPVNSITDQSVKEGEKNSENSTGVLYSAIKDTTNFNDSLITSVNYRSSSKQPNISSDTLLSESDTLPSNKSKHCLQFLSMKNWGYQAGLGFEKANDQLGFSVLGEVLFTKNWSLSMGLRLLNNTNSYYDNNEFCHKKGQNFKDVYHSNVSDTSSITNIEISNQLIQIPVTLSYRLPLKNYFSLLFGIGTDIDLHAQQSISFKHRGINSQYEHSNFNINYPVLMVNNAVVTVGIQKQWKRFVGQVSPFISPQLMSVAYKKEDLYFGLRCRVFYSF